MGDEGLFKAYEQGQGALFPMHLAEGLDPSDDARLTTAVLPTGN